MEFNIVVENVNKKIDGNEILKNVNLNFSNGKIYGLVGRNGSGKSMLLKTICGFLIPDEGRILAKGIDIYKEKIFPENTRALIEKPSFISNASGYDNLKWLAEIQKIISDKEINETLELVGLYGEKDKKYGKYSLGMKQKLGIASVLMENPDIMIFDEPFNGIDEKSIERIRNIILEKKKEGKLIIIATHIKEDLELLCDEIFKIESGSVIDKKGE